VEWDKVGTSVLVTGNKILAHDEGTSARLEMMMVARRVTELAGGV
jgi:hypothetical protein